MADDNIERIPIRDLHQEEGAYELATSPDIELYLEFITAAMQDHDPSAELDAIRQLPLEKRYVWRVASALKWGLADCEGMGVESDKQTLTLEDLSKVMDLLKYRPMQVAIVLKALAGADEMQTMRMHTPEKIISVGGRQALQDMVELEMYLVYQPQQTPWPMLPRRSKKPLEPEKTPSNLVESSVAKELVKQEFIEATSSRTFVVSKSGYQFYDREIKPHSSSIHKSRE